jgi:hypothetical protein
MQKCDERFIAFFGVWCFFLLLSFPFSPNNGSSRGDGPLLTMKENFMTKVVEKNYTDAQEAILLAAGIIDNAKAIELAGQLQKDVRSIRAKAVRMGIYKAMPKVSKTGGKVESKDDIVADIAKIVGKNLDGLEKAPKVALQIIRSKIAA